MYLHVQNLGPIKEGRIDLSKDFYLFVGYNNSGKTYLAHLLWAIFHSLANFDLDELYFKEESFLDVGDFIEDAKYAEQLMENGVEVTHDIVERTLQAFTQYIENKVFPAALNVSTNHTILHNFSMRFELDADDYEQKILKKSLDRWDNDWDYGPSRFRKKKNSQHILWKYEGQENLGADLKPKEEWYLLSGWLNLLSICLLRLLFEVDYVQHLQESSVCSSISNIPFYLPASRVFYSTFYDYVFVQEKRKKDELLRQLQQGEERETLLQRFKSKYTQPMNILLERSKALVQSYDRDSEKRNQLYARYHHALQEILGGEIALTQQQGVAGVTPPLEFSLMLDNEAQDTLDMYLASSSVNQLLCVDLFFRYWADVRHNFLIIDEPEENLHPHNQLKLLNLLIKFANQGNKVLLTTHSPLLAEAVNSHIHLGVLKEHDIDAQDLLEQGDFNEYLDIDAELTAEDAGVYFFDGESILEYDIGNYGVLFRDFVNVERKLSTLNDLLTDEIYELKEHGE